MDQRRGLAQPCRLAAASILAAAALLAGGGAAAAKGESHPAANGGSAQAPAHPGDGARGRNNHASSGDSNRGDVWTDNVGQPAGPGHEQDPHLACADINIWGAGLADAAGTYSVDGWPPSGGRAQDYASTWTYDTASGGDQVIAVIDYQRLLATAVANGDAPKNRNGFHFKLNLVQDPQKHKTFWLACATPSHSGGGQGSAGAGTTTSGGGSGRVPGTPAPGPSSAGTVVAGPAAAGSVLGVSTSQPAGSAAGALGLSPSIPATGAAVAGGLALALVVGGSAALVIGRRRRDGHPV